MIPKIINYIFGLDQKFCNKPFNFFHYLNIISAKKINQNYTINLYYYYEPENVIFEKLSDICNLIKLEDLNFNITNSNLAYTEHLSDIIRLDLINKFGGIYLDIDTICLKPFDNLLDNKFVMGLEYGRHSHDNEQKLIGLCNAVLMSEKKSEFSSLWLEDYKNNYQLDWNYNSVRRPLELAKTNPTLIHIEPQSSFFKYSWDSYGFESLFKKNECVNECYLLHLWESKNYETLIKYSPDYILRNVDTVSNIYKILLNYVQQ